MATTRSKNTAVLLIKCPDQKGIVAFISEFLFNNKGNVIHLDQHVDTKTAHFYMRVEWELQDFVIPRDKIAEYFQTLIAEKYQIDFDQLDNIISKNPDEKMVDVGGGHFIATHDTKEFFIDS